MRLSLRWKLVGGFGLMLALIALLGWVTFALFGSFRSVQREVLNDAIPGLVTADELVRSYTAQSGAIRGYLIGSELALLDQYGNEVAAAALLEDRARSIFTSPTEADLLTGLIRAGHAFQALVDRDVIPLARQGKRSQAFRVLSQEGSPLVAQVETLGRELAQAQDRIVVESEAELRLRANQTRVILVLVVVGTLTVGILLAFLFPQRLTANLSRLVEATRAIGRGDLDQKVEIHSGDELGELAERLREMQAGLKRLQQLALQDRELEIAASIQRNLLQRTLPEVPGLELFPSQRLANLVGGDWYDVDLTDGQLTVVVGDASGKGIGAALMATVALSVLRSERASGAGARKIVERANQALREATDAESFTTCVYTTLDMSSGSLRILNMGHTSPFVMRPPDDPGATGASFSGKYIEGSRNRVLGWFDDPGYTEEIVELQPGDRLVLFTDGFLEAKSPDGEVFGEHRLADALLALAPLGSAVVARDLVTEVERFAAGKLDDDLTLLVLEFEGVGVAPVGDDRGDITWHSRR